MCGGLIACECTFIGYGKGLAAMSMNVQQEQDCLQLNEQINTAFIWLIAFSTDNFQVQLNEPMPLILTFASRYTVVLTIGQCNSTIRFIAFVKITKQKVCTFVESLPWRPQKIV